LGANINSHVYIDDIVAYGGNCPLAKPADWKDERKLIVSSPTEITANLIDVRPNPFKYEAAITYNVPVDPKHDHSSACLKVYDINGVFVKELLSDIKISGTYLITWDGKDNTGKKVKNGIYFYEYRVGNKKEANRIIYLK
jgi:hypothetical protein